MKLSRTLVAWAAVVASVVVAVGALWSDETSSAGPAAQPRSGAGRMESGDSATDGEEQSRGNWSRLDETTVELDGGVGTLDDFEAVFDDQVETVRLASGGGDTYEAIQMGMRLREAGVDTVAVGLCASSCANYLFTAGQRRIIEGGIVGFHGNVTALVNEAGGLEALLATIPEDDREDVRQNIGQTMAWEAQFFADLGIDQALFDRTQRVDKGMGEGRDYSLLLPTPATFEQYGIHGVEGQQDPELVAAINASTGRETVIVA